MNCPKCGGPMWDETKSKWYDPSKNKPIWRCKRGKDECDGVIWAPRGAKLPPKPQPPAFEGDPGEDDFDRAMAASKAESAPAKGRAGLTTVKQDAESLALVWREVLEQLTALRQWANDAGDPFLMELVGATTMETVQAAAATIRISRERRG